MEVETQIEEPSIPLDSWNQVKGRDSPSLYVPWEEASFFGLEKKLGFSSVRPNGNLTCKGHIKKSQPQKGLDELIIFSMPKYTFSRSWNNIMLL